MDMEGVDEMQIGMRPDQGDASRYEDIMDLPHHVSTVHPRMDALKRAAQFAPFSALMGYGDAVAEAQRITEGRVELDEDSREILDQKLQMVMERPDEWQKVEITYFVPDEKKSGGAYVVAPGRIDGIDMYKRRIVMEDGTEVPLDEVMDIALHRIEE